MEYMDFLDWGRKNIVNSMDYLYEKYNVEPINCNPKILVRMRSAVRICPAAPEKFRISIVLVEIRNFSFTFHF